ncbi:MAG TPA: phosphoribosylanthranilate isomerase [Acidimicrobiia bacterium]|nr:phosphoribosylanthranilate isomerase [Acidimicrobiia bacterium]
MFIKICGVTDVTAAETCVAAGVDAIGFVFSSSPRQVTPSQAASIADAIPDSIAKVAVFRRPSLAEIETVLAGFEADLVQADHDTMTDYEDVDLLPVYRETDNSEPVRSRFLYEGAVSGVGRQVDLERASKWGRLGEMILAGGLRPGIVGYAIERVRPFGVDVSSGVELEPGVKSPDLIRSFVRAVRSAERRLVNT